MAPRTAAMTFPLLAAAFLFAACGDDEPSVPTETPTATPASVELKDIGPQAVWSPAGDVIRQVWACRQRRFTCVRELMEEQDAPGEAIAFFRATQWFMSDFVELGPVDLAFLSDPWRANSNDDYALLNGSPSMIYVEDAITTNAQSPFFKELDAAYDKLFIWTWANRLESAGTVPDGTGQQFVFQYSLNDDCNACATGYWVRVTLNFSDDGTHLGTGLLGPCAGDLPADAVLLNIEPCPTPEPLP